MLLVDAIDRQSSANMSQAMLSPPQSPAIIGCGKTAGLGNTKGRLDQICLELPCTLCGKIGRGSVLHRRRGARPNRTGQLQAPQVTAIVGSGLAAGARDQTRKICRRRAAAGEQHLGLRGQVVQRSKKVRQEPLLAHAFWEQSRANLVRALDVDLGV